jgi:flavin reductase (DIM6/NTAB) family NADH-FMN oxidoreductase RutF
MAYRRALGAFVTGVTVVTTIYEERPRGFTANSFTSISLDPPLILVCVDKKAGSFVPFSKVTSFAVNVLADNQRRIANVFASKGTEKFSAVAWQPATSGSPLIPGASAWFDCALHERHDGGDHQMLIGRVIDFHGEDRAALGYWRGGYVFPTLEETALTAINRGGRVGAILERDDAIALLAGPDGMFDLPSSKKMLPAENKDTLYGKLAEFGITPRLDFIFAVVHEEPDIPGEISVYYRGRIEGEIRDDARLQMIPFGNIKDVNLNSATEQSMLQRFIRERQQPAFGVYMGDNRGGVVKQLMG